MKRVNDFIESILDRLSPNQEFDPWGNQPTPTPLVTDEDLDEAVNQMKQKPRKTIHPVIVSSIKFVVGVWFLGHLGLLYMMLGSPISGGILVIVVVNASILRHYLILLGKVNKNE